MKREPRLHFTDADLAEPKLKKPIRRVEKAAAKADKAQAKIPKKTVVKKERGFDPATGKVKTQIRFEEVDKKKPPSKLTHAVQDAPANLVLSQFHREVQQSEDDNVGVESAHKLESAAESGGRLIQSAHRSHQLKPYRAAARAETRLEKANINALQKKAQIEHPTSNPVSKWSAKTGYQKAVCRHQVRQDCKKHGKDYGEHHKGGKESRRENQAGRTVCMAAQKGIRHCRRAVPDPCDFSERAVLLLCNAGGRWLRDRCQHLSFPRCGYAGCGSGLLRYGSRTARISGQL
jgi:hypothetical protein